MTACRIVLDRDASRAQNTHIAANNPEQNMNTTTYTIASENGEMVITKKFNGRETKYVAYRDGSFKAFSKNARGVWCNFSRGAMAAKRFGWEKKAADEYFAA
jgi:hypothetical protein